jgi:hypothetical protein
MYNPPTFLSADVLSEVLAEFSWPAPYTLDDDLPDGIEVRLPRCHLYVSEGFESHMSVKFMADSTGLDRNVAVIDVLVALRADPNRVLPADPPLIKYFSPGASLDKVKNEIRDELTLVFTFCRPSLDGDFDWVPAYRAHAG